MNNWLEIEEKHSSGAYGGWPMTIVRGNGSYLWDSDDKKYLDLSTGIGVASLGHSNLSIKNALNEQAGKLISASHGYYGNDVRALYLEKLSEISPKNLNRIFLCNSGTEAVEGAIKLARLVSKKSKILSCVRGYHGRTLGALSATWKEAMKAPFNPIVPNFEHVPFGKIDPIKNKNLDEVAAILIEPIQGEGGIYSASKSYLNDLKNLCLENDILLIFDEVQCGFGRTGEWFASQYFDIEPDIISIAKAQGGGVPIGAVIFNDNLKFEKKMHGSTYGGNPLACAVGISVIDFIIENDILNNVKKMGEYFKAELNNLLNLYPNILKDVRGVGLMIALQFRGPAGPALMGLLDKGVLALTAGKPNLRFLPPYIITKDEIDFAISSLKEVLGEVS